MLDWNALGENRDEYDDDDDGDDSYFEVDTDCDAYKMYHELEKNSTTQRVLYL